MTTTAVAPLTQPSKDEIATREAILNMAVRFKLPSPDGKTALSMVHHAEPGVVLINGIARRAIHEMFSQYAHALTRDGLTAETSAINLARKALVKEGYVVDTNLEDGKPFGLAMKWFHSAIADAKVKLLAPAE